MTRVLCVAEKNDAAKSIANILTNNQAQRTEGRSKYNKIYRFDYQFRGQQAHFAMTSVSGHLLNLEFTPAHRTWRQDSIGALFDAPVQRSTGPNMQLIEQTLTYDF